MRTMQWIRLVTAVAVLIVARPAGARIKLVALPERQDTVIRLDNPTATLIEEERVLTLQAGRNQVDFSWKSVAIDPESIRLQVLDHPNDVTLLSVSYPPDEGALVWDIASTTAFAERVRISYLLGNIDRLVTYKAVADANETALDLKSYVVLRNFSGEDFDRARVQLDYGEAFDSRIQHEETKQMLLLRVPAVPIEKVWTFDAAKLPWDPERLEGRNVGIPVAYRLKNERASGLGRFALWGGKARLYQDDGHGGTIFLGEDRTGLVPVGEDTSLTLGDSRDLVVTQRTMRDRKINVRRNHANQVILYDTDEVLSVKIENFKDRPAVLTLIEHIPGQWDMERCTRTYERRDANTLVFEIDLPARDGDEPGGVELSLAYHRRNVPAGQTVATMRHAVRRALGPAL